MKHWCDYEGRSRAFPCCEAWFLDLVASVMVAEAEACRQRMQLAKDAGTTSIIIETNSKLVVDLW
jgi:ribonuclease HI